MEQSAQNSQDGIIWICSYPKSGNTWLRLLLANYFYATDGKPVTINTVQSVIRGDASAVLYQKLCEEEGWDFASAINDMDKRERFMQRYVQDSKGSVFLKSHSCFHQLNNRFYFPQNATKAFISIVRDPRDVLCSFSHHRGVPIEETWEVMKNQKNLLTSKIGKKEYTSSWDAHVSSFVEIGCPSIILRYEDLLEKTPQVMETIVKSLLGSVDQKQLDFAIEHSAFPVLQEQEEKEGFREAAGQNDRFFAKGKAGGWQNVLSAAQAKKVEKQFEPTMKRFGYL